MSNVPLMAAVADTPEGLLVSDDSGAVNYQGKACAVSIDHNHVLVRNLDQKKTLVLDLPSSALTGMRYKTVKARGKNYFKAELYFYLVKTSCFGGKRLENVRQRRVLTLFFHTDESVLMRWVQSIQLFVGGKSLDGEAQAPVADTLPGAPRRFVVFVNPKSGSGTAIAIWKRVVEPMLAEAGIAVTAVITERANQAKEYVGDSKNLGLDVEAVLIVGGDGLLFEVVNGMGLRPDADELFQRVALAPIPGGTGNGLVKSILFRIHEHGAPLNAAFCAIKGVSYPLDLSKVVTKSGHRHLSFLSLAWGLIADVDILSESMRFLGEMRLYVAAVYFLIARRRYEGRLQMKLVQDAPRFQSGSFASVSSISVEPKHAAVLKDPTKINRILPGDQVNGDGWVTLESRFVMVFVLQTSHCSMSVYSGPGAELKDGLFTVIVVQDIGRAGLTSLLLSMDSGDYVNNSKVRIFKCTQYILEPLTDRGRFSLDGELIEYGRVEGDLMPSAARVKSLY